MAGLATSDRWNVLTASEQAELALVAELGVTPLVAQVMAARGITSLAEADKFLHPSLKRDWEDPLKIPGMDAAATRVCQAINAGEKIAVFGDFDVDGMSSTALLTQALRELGAAEVRPYIPDRFDEGYGLSVSALERVLSDGMPDLVITVDNGIAAAHEVAWLVEKNIDVVVTDHHEPADLVPECSAVVDPKLSNDCPSRDLSGAGVALKLVCELGRRRNAPDVWRSYTDLATLGTVSDMMRLVGENRALVADGIAWLRHTERPGIVALAGASRCDLRSLTSDELPFSLVPRLNAAGRMGHTEVAFGLLMAQDVPSASELAAKLEAINTERRQIEAQLAADAFAKADAQFTDGDLCVVVSGEGWHEGVKGIVASRLTNRYHVPSILFTVSDGVARGSGRSVGSVDLFHALEACSDVCLRFGGHAAAVGVTLEASRINEFRARLSAELAKLPPSQFIAKGEVAAVVGLSDLTVDTIRSLEVLQPFGQANAKPLLAATGVTMKNRGRVGATGDHLRFTATDGFAHVSAICFRAPHIDRAVACDQAVDLVFEPVAETWQGSTKPKLMVRDILFRSAPETSCPVSCTPLALDEPSTATTESFPTDGPSSDNPSGKDASSPSSSRREELAALSPSELNRTLVSAFIGNHALLPAQARALEQLEAGISTLCVMATGRGKSLIFYLHAARLAITQRKASVFVYPLRALVGDQAHHLAQTFEPLGLTVSTLTGESSEAERAATYAGLTSGAVDVVLTTPEFLCIHAKKFAATGRIGFVTIDEAHHAGRAKAGERVCYLELPQVLEALGHPCVLAVSATANTEVATEICRLCGCDADRVVLDCTERENLVLDDHRGIQDRDAALISLVALKQKSVIYVNSRGEAQELCRKLRHALPDLASRVAFYHAGLSRAQRVAVEQAFRDGRVLSIVSTSAFGEGVNLPDIRHVVLYHLPFGTTEFNQMSGRAGRDGAPATIHLLFGQHDAHINEHLLNSAAPTRQVLVDLWKVLVGLAQLHNYQFFSVATEELARQVNALKNPVIVDEKSIDAGLQIFSELHLVQDELRSDVHTLLVARSPERVELSNSIRYLEGIRSKDSFAEFRTWALGSSADEMISRITRPITPGFGQVVSS